MKLLKLFYGCASQLPHRTIHTGRTLYDAVLIDGNKISRQVLDEIKSDIDTIVNAGNKRPRLVAILVGDNPASKSYVGRKIKAAKYVGIDSETIYLDANITQERLLESIESFNADKTVDGLLVQLPVPDGICEQTVCQAVSPTKDVDGFHLNNIGSLSLNAKGIIPATAYGVRELIVRTKIETHGKNAVVIGRSKHVGFPIAILLHSDAKAEVGGLDMTTVICHRYTPPSDLEHYLKTADVVVASAGVPGLVKKSMIKPGACVIDVGINRIQKSDGKYGLVGDIDFDEVKKVAGYITPVPGGVGPMTVAMLMKNTLEAAKNRSYKNENYV